MDRRTTRFLVSLAVALATLGPASAAPAEEGGDIPRTADGRPDLTGTYETATLTPLERPREFGDKLFVTPAEAEAIAKREQALLAADAQPIDPDREAPPVGGDGSTGAAGNVGGYNAFWIDRGNGYFMLDGKFRTSIIVDPPNGRRPSMTDEAQRQFEARIAQFRRQNDGTAPWALSGEPGPYDDPEIRALGERCLLGFGSTSGPPMLPVLYNNIKRIVQTPDYVVILVEMNHDARIIPLDKEHGSPEIRKWMGDSVAHWEGDALVIDTVNFRDETGLRGGSRNLHVVERFTRLDENRLLYHFTVEDPSTWTAPWSGEYPWVATDEQLYEYACHEGNYAMGNILRGARLLEAETVANSSQSDSTTTPPEEKE